MISDLFVRLRITFSFLLFFTAILTFGTSPGFAAKDPEPIRIGATVSKEGKYAVLSYMVLHGYKVWVEEVNKRGGLLGRHVELLTYDDKSNPDLVGDLYEKLIVEDQVDLVLSPYGSSLTLEAAKVAEKHGMAMLAATASSRAIWNRGFKNIFGVYSTADRYFIGFLDLVARQRMKTVAIIYNNTTTFNLSAAQGGKKWALLYGLELQDFAKYDDHVTELPSIIKKLEKNLPENIVFCGYPEEGYHFLKLLEKSGLRPKGLALSVTAAMPDFYENVGPFAENIFGPSQWEADTRLPFPGVSNFIENFKLLTGQYPSYQACSSYSACQIFEKAIKKEGKIDHTEIRNFISNLDTVTIMGRFKVDIDGQQIGHNPILIQWQNGKKEIVYPRKMRTAPGIFQENPKE